MADGRPDWIGDPEEHPGGDGDWLPVRQQFPIPNTTNTLPLTPSRELERRNKDRRNDRK